MKRAATWHKKSSKIRNLGTIAQVCRAISLQVRHVSTVRKNILSRNTFLTSPYNMVSFGPLTAEIILLVWGTPANFNGFRVLASLLQRCRSPEANQTVYNVWPSPGLVHHIHFRGLLPRALAAWWNFARCNIHFTFKSCILLYWHITAWHSSSGHQPNCGIVHGVELWNFCRGCHLYSAGRPSRWASAHILAVFDFSRTTSAAYAVFFASKW